MKLLPFLLSLVLLVVLSTDSLEAAPGGATRNFRPLAPKSVRIELAEKAGKPGVEAAPTRKGWKEFDAGRWEKAMDAFLSALEANPGDASAAEGLTMAVYRSGDRISAAQLGEEFSVAMPWIRDAVVETLIVDVRREMADGKIREVRELAAGLPHAGGAYDEVRLLAESKGEPGDVRIDGAGPGISSMDRGNGALIDVSFPGNEPAAGLPTAVALSSVSAMTSLRAEPLRDQRGN